MCLDSGGGGGGGGMGWELGWGAEAPPLLKVYVCGVRK